MQAEQQSDPAPPAALQYGDATREVDMDWTGADAVLRAQLEDAQRDVRLWLACTLPNEERLYVRAIQERLAVLEQIFDHRICGIASDGEEGRWGENKRAFLDLFHMAIGARGCAVKGYEVHVHTIKTRLAFRSFRVVKNRKGFAQNRGIS